MLWARCPTASRGPRGARPACVVPSPLPPAPGRLPPLLFHPPPQRAQMVADIKAEFRANAGLSEPEAVRQARRAALRGLEQLQEFAGLDRAAPDWQVSLKGACE